jgi:uncharacterized protein (DUF1499 family)
MGWSANRLGRTITPHSDEQTVSVRKLAAATDPRHWVGMTPLAWLVGFLLPACGASGAGGLPIPPLLDMSHIQRPASPNTTLAAPAGGGLAPDIVTPVFAVPASRLYPAVMAVAADQPRTFMAAEYPAVRQAHFVARSAVFNFPDLVAAQVNEAGADRSTLVLYSRSVYGYSDFGVNRQRLQGWLADLRTRLNPTDER